MGHWLMLFLMQHGGGSPPDARDFEPLAVELFLSECVVSAMRSQPPELGLLAGHDEGGL